jgi:hypothetical protein
VWRKWDGVRRMRNSANAIGQAAAASPPPHTGGFAPSLVRLQPHTGGFAPSLVRLQPHSPVHALSITHALSRQPHTCLAADYIASVIAPTGGCQAGMQLASNIRSGPPSASSRMYSPGGGCLLGKAQRPPPVSPGDRRF